MGFLQLVFQNFFKFDWIIFVLLAVNGYVYAMTLRATNLLYAHFVKSNQLGGLHAGAKRKILANTAPDRQLTTTELMQGRKTMNRSYALYVNLTSMFPLLGMLGTVYSLLPMVQTLEGGTNTDGFFLALTSTFWGIVAALIFKGLDAALSYKIEDNEKYMEYLLRPQTRDESCVL